LYRYDHARPFLTPSACRVWPALMLKTVHLLLPIKEKRKHLVGISKTEQYLRTAINKTSFQLKQLQKDYLPDAHTHNDKEEKCHEINDSLFSLLTA
jgi:hypothetical protein